MFMRAQRQHNFLLYVAVLRLIMKYVFIWDHTNYARWLSVHLKELLEMEQSHPQLFTEFFDRGHFVVTKTGRPHSCIAIDQAHAQLNRILKSATGGLDFLNRDDDLEALMRFIITSPIVAEMCMEYEDTFGPWPINLDEHHECYSAFQMNFFEDVKRLLDCFESSLNPFSSLCPTALCFVHNGNTIPMKILQSHYDRYSLKVSSYTKIIQRRAWRSVQFLYRLLFHRINYCFHPTMLKLKQTLNSNL